MNIREEEDSDIQKVWKVNAEAFETEGEANLVNDLRNSGTSYISLVAEEGEDIIGHILFTPVDLIGDKSDVRVMGLAPMAVVVKYQRKGVGSQLVKVGIERCKAHGCDALVVLGHPEYYPKFGFVPSVDYRIKSEYEVPDEVFMVLELSDGSLKNKAGTIRFHAAFDKL